MKPDHDFHFRQYKIRYFPVRFFLVSLFFFFIFGLFLGNFWGEFHSTCQLQSILHH